MPHVRRRSAIGVALVTVLAGLFIAFALWPQPEEVFRPQPGVTYGNRELLDDAPPVTLTGMSTTITSGLRQFRDTVWITEDDAGLVVDRTPITCHGGMAHVVWHIGNLEPIIEDAGLHLAMRMDEHVIGGLLRGTDVHTWGDDPASMHAVVSCPEGPHVVDLLVRATNGAWGFPYVVNAGEPPPDDLSIGRGFIVTEIWN